MSFWDSQVNGTWYIIDFQFELALVFCLFFLSTHTQTLTHKALLGRLFHCVYQGVVLPLAAAHSLRMGSNPYADQTPFSNSTHNRRAV